MFNIFDTKKCLGLKNVFKKIQKSQKFLDPNLLSLKNCKHMLISTVQGFKPF